MEVTNQANSTVFPDGSAATLFPPKGLGSFDWVQSPDLPKKCAANIRSRGIGVSRQNKLWSTDLHKPHESSLVLH